MNATDQTNIYKNKWLDLHNAWQLHYPGFESTYLFQTRPGCFTGPDWGGITPEQNILGNLKIMEAQRQLAEEIETVQIMSSGGMNHFGCLFGYINGYERAGDDIYRLLAKDLYDSGAGLAIYPPTVASVSMMENEPDQLLLTFQHPEDELIITSGLEHHFRLEGSLGIEILSLQATENGVRFQLSNVPEPGFTGLSYAPYPASNESPVKNERGIGLLGFYNKPVIITNIIEPSLASGAVKVYPNPTLGGSAIYLEVKAGFELNALELYGVGGSLVYIKNFTHPAEGNIRITPQVDSGVYHLKIKLSNEQIISKKIIIH